MTTRTAPARPPADHPTRHRGTAAGWADSTRAELRRLLGWPATWILAGVWITLQVLFSFAFPYIAFRTGDPDAFQGGPTYQVLESMLPVALPETLIQGTPMFGGAIVMIFAALAVGGTYNWGTWKTVLTLGPGRGAAAGGTAAAIGVCLAGLVLSSAALTLGLSALVGLVESQPLTWPDWGEAAAAVGASALILGMWAAFGMCLGALARGPALSVGLALLWSFAVENLLRGTANLLEGLSAVTDVLPGSAAGSLAGAISGPSGDGDGGAPGVLHLLSGPTAAWLLAAYLVVFTAATLVLIRRRDVA